MFKVCADAFLESGETSRAGDSSRAASQSAAGAAQGTSERYRNERAKMVCTVNILSVIIAPNMSSITESTE